MHSRFALPTSALALSLTVVLGSALLALLVAGGGATRTTAPLSQYVRPILGFLACGAMAGIAAWTTLFVMKRDGYHRMEWIAFQPFNYGGRSPFDTTPFPKN